MIKQILLPLVFLTLVTGEVSARNNGPINGHSPTPVPTTTSYPRFVYVANSGDNTVSIYAIDAQTGQPRGRGYALTGSRPSAVVENNGFVYVANAGSNDISTYRTDPVTGQLAEEDLVSTAEQPTAMIIHGKWLFVAGMNGVIATHEIGAAGELTRRTTYSGLPETKPTAFAIDAANNILFVANRGTGSVDLFVINSNTGYLTPLKTCSIGGEPSGLAYSAKARALIVTNSQFERVTVHRPNNKNPDVCTVTSLNPTGGVPVSVAVDAASSSVYVANRGSNLISTFSLGINTGVLTEHVGPQSRVPTGSDPVALAGDSGGNFLYAVNFNSYELQGFKISRCTSQGPLGCGGIRGGTKPGSLLPTKIAHKVAARSEPVAIAVSSGPKPLTFRSKYLYGTAEYGTWQREHSIYGGRILGVGERIPRWAPTQGGELIEIDGSPFKQLAERPSDIALDPYGRFAYVIHIGKYVAAYQVDRPTGQLKPLVDFQWLFLSHTGRNPRHPAFATSDSPRGITVDPSGRFVYVSTGANTVDGFTIDMEGQVAADPSIANLPNGITGKTIGGLIPMGAFVTNSQYPRGITIDPTGRFLFVASPGNHVDPNPYGEVTAFLIAPKNGTLLRIGTYASSPGAAYPTVDPTGRYLYVANWRGANVTGFTIDSRTGQLTPMNGSPFATGPLPVQVAVNPTGQYAYVVTEKGRTIEKFKVSSGGMLVPDGAPLVSDSLPIYTDMVPHSVAITADSSHLYVGDRSGSAVRAFKLDQNGTATPLLNHSFFRNISSQPVLYDVIE